MSAARTTCMLVVFAFAFAFASGCVVDPVHEDAVDALGPETPGVPGGPLHRPGQPCLVCHGGDGPADLELTFAGTVYTAPKAGVVLPGAHVRIVDHDQRSHDTETNCAGNFYVRRDDFTASFPAVVAVTTQTTSPMRTLMNRSGSCNDCHTETPGADSPGRAWAQAWPPGRAAGDCD